MKRILALSFAVALVGTGCDNFCFGDSCEADCSWGSCGTPACTGNGNSNCGTCDGWDCNPHWNYPFCDTDADCFEGERCSGGECRWDDPTWCDTNQDCPEGQICSLSYECEEAVSGCPLTDECLADPEGYTPDWVGIDPVYMGTASGGGIDVRIEFLVDFYDDHLYGEAVVLVEGAQNGQPWMNLIVTGDRSGAQIDGQVLDRDAAERWFDATFSGELLSSSEIVGTVTVATDDGTFQLIFHLFRTSPCGCDVTPCAADSDCPSGQSCQNGSCVEGCIEECCADSDCPSGYSCQNNACVPPCVVFECCVNADCGVGESCQDHQCVPSCALEECCQDADCPADNICQNNQCVLSCTQQQCCQDADCPADNTCQSNQCVPTCTLQECCQSSDCAAGLDCVAGECKTPCTTPCECPQGQLCISGYCEVP